MDITRTVHEQQLDHWNWRFRFIKLFSNIEHFLAASLYIKYDSKIEQKQQIALNSNGHCGEKWKMLRTK